MEWIVADLKIAVVLLAWIVAMVGIGNVVYNIINSRKTKVNSSLGNHCIDLANFEHSQTHSLASRPKFSKEAKAPTADTRILGESQGDSMEFNAESPESSLRDSANAESWQSTVKNNPHEVRTNSRSASWCIKRGAKEAEVPPLFLCKKRNQARLSPKSEKAAAFLCVGEQGGGAALFAKKSDYINETNLAKSRQIERAENAESHTESLKDSSDSIESIKMDCHDWKLSQNLTMTAKGDSVESSEKIKMDLQVWASCGRNARHANPCGLSRNDKVMATPHKNTESHNNNTSPTSSLRGDLSPKQSINANNLAESRRIERAENAESHTESNAESLKDSADSIESIKMDCHDWKLSQNLTMTAKGDSVESSEKIKMDLQVWASCGRNARHANPCGLSRNDGIGVDCHEVVPTSRNDASTIDCHEALTSRNDDFKPRHCEGAKQPKQSILQHQKSSDFADSSDFTQSPTIFPDNFAIRIFASLLFGVIIVSFLASLLHLFIPITPIVSIAFLALGIALFALKIRDFHLLDFRVLFSGAVAFAIVAILGFFHDSIGDSVNYHIQIVTWIQNSPLIFGLGNIHGRLGFNGIIYNFYALSDVSQIFPTLRSFIANEIIYFAFIFAVVYILATGAFRRFYLLFIVCCAIPFSFVLKWAEFNALHCEGIGLVFGVFVGAMVCYVVGNQRKQKANSSLGNHCIDLAFSHKARTPSPLSLCQNAKNSTSTTASRRLDERSEVPNTRILGEMQSDSAKDSDENNPVIARLDEVKSWQSINKINPHEVRTNSRSASWCIKREKKEAEVPPLFLCKNAELARLSPKSETAAACFSFGLSASHQPLARLVGERGKYLKNMSAALFAKKSDYINENISIESKRSERAENAESHTESLKDSSDSAESSKSNLVDCHDWKLSQNLTMTAKGDSVESSEKIKMDLQVWASCGRNARHANPCGLSRNDGIGVDCQIDAFADSRNDGALSIPRKSLKSNKPTMTRHTHFANALLFILFIMSVFAAQVKIANTALCLCVAIIFIYLNRDFYRTKFYKKYAILGILCVIFVLPWAIKGVATSGMVAYPAGLFFFESLPFAVSEAQRESEVCWIMSWARAPGKNCVEVLSSSAWVGEWFSMKTRYFGWYFKHFVYNFFASLALLIAIVIYAKAQKRRIDSTKYLIVFLAMFAGAIFWFFSGPDPRFGMVYIFPLIGILLAFNITEIKNIASKKARIVFIVALLFTLMPFWKLTRDMYIILILLCVLLPSLSVKWRKFYYALLVILSFVSIPNIYRKQLGSIKQLPKVLPIYAKEQITDYGVSVFHRSDELKEGYKAYDYEPMPTTPYFSSHIKEERFLGRKAYINANKESK